MNILIYLIILILSILSIYISKKLLNNLGLTITFIGMSTLSFFLSFKYITLSTININSNSITYITMFTALYLLLENTDKKEIKKIINLNFLLNIFISIMIFLMTYHTQSITDSISINMTNVFFNNYKILLVYPITTLISNYSLIVIYNKIKKLYDLPFITTVTTFMLVGLMEGILYNILVYRLTLSSKTIIEIILATYMIRLIITVIYSLFISSITKEKVKKWQV